MMKKLATALLLSIAVTDPAVATEMYVGVKLGIVNYGYSNVTNNSQMGFGFLGGYAFSENFAVEAEYNNLGGFDSPAFPPETIKGSSFGLSGVGSYPFSQEFSLYGKLGISNSTLRDTVFGVTTDITNTGVNAGFGGQYNISKEIGIRVGIDIYQVGDSASGTSSAKMMHAGGVFKF